MHSSFLNLRNGQVGCSRRDTRVSQEFACAHDTFATACQDDLGQRIEAGNLDCAFATLVIAGTTVSDLFDHARDFLMRVAGIDYER